MGVFLEPMVDIQISCPNVCLCIFVRGDHSFPGTCPLNGFITMAGCICNIGHASALTYVQAYENVHISNRGLKSHFSFLKNL